MSDENRVSEEDQQPSQPKGAGSVMVGTRVTLDVLADMDSLATSVGATRSDIVSEALAAWLGQVTELKILEDIRSLAQMRDHLATIYHRLDSQDSKLDQILNFLRQ